MKIIASLALLSTLALAACSSTGNVAHYRDDTRSGIVLAAAVTQNFDPPSRYCDVGGRTGDRTVWVISDEPQRLALLGNGRNELPCSQTSWQRTGRGYETQVSFPSSYAFDFGWLRLLREDGRGASRWDADNGAMKHLRNSNVGKGDPACVGGHNWCATRGL